MNTKEDTIVARATPAGEGAIAVIRISGPDAIAMTDSLFVGSKKLADAPGYTIHYGKI
ncbi:partial tRNA modification GTPase MnmE, partial [Candidatus Brocadiaceae bacterium]